MAAEVLGFVKRHRNALLLAAGALYLFPKVRQLAAEEHTQPRLLGSAPDPSLFPNFFFSHRGLWIYVRHWLVPKPIGHVFICHGLGEHIQRYEVLATRLNAQGYSVHGMDHQGHGFSEGDRGYFPSLAGLVDDYVQFISTVQCDGLPCFLIGHSMGGLLTVLIGSRTEGKWRGIVLSGAALEPDPKVASPVKLSAANFVGNLLPKLQVEPLDPAGVCSNPQVVERYKLDPLVYHGGLRLRVVTELLSHMPIAVNLARTSKWPSMFVLHGARDPICLFQGSQKFFDNLTIEDKELRIYPNMSHEIFNEDGELAIQDAIAWIKKRTEK